MASEKPKKKSASKKREGGPKKSPASSTTKAKKPKTSSGRRKAPKKAALEAEGAEADTSVEKRRIAALEAQIRSLLSEVTIKSTALDHASQEIEVLRERLVGAGNIDSAGAAKRLAVADGDVRLAASEAELYEQIRELEGRVKVLEFKLEAAQAHFDAQAKDHAAELIERIEAARLDGAREAQEAAEAVLSAFEDRARAELEQALVELAGVQAELDTRPTHEELIERRQELEVQMRLAVLDAEKTALAATEALSWTEDRSKEEIEAAHQELTQLRVKLEARRGRSSGSRPAAVDVSELREMLQQVLTRVSHTSGETPGNGEVSALKNAVIHDTLAEIKKQLEQTQEQVKKLVERAPAAAGSNSGSTSGRTSRTSPVTGTRLLPAMGSGDDGPRVFPGAPSFTGPPSFSGPPMLHGGPPRFGVPQHLHPSHIPGGPPLGFPPLPPKPAGFKSTQMIQTGAQAVWQDSSRQVVQVPMGPKGGESGAVARQALRPEDLSSDPAVDVDFDPEEWDDF
ncbi:MAG: hypothetical protein ACYS22_00885 [Planctomycetota bacterium]|jgi:hypothetical protein